jgi:hypothetical protein
VDEKLRSGPIEAPAESEDVFRAHFAPVYRFIARRVGTDLAEDLAAEAFATAYRRRASYDPARGSVRSWLFGIAANVLREHWRDEQELLELDARLASGGARSFDSDADSRVVVPTPQSRMRPHGNAPGRPWRWPRVRMSRRLPVQSSGGCAGSRESVSTVSPRANWRSPPPSPSWPVPAPE